MSVDVDAGTWALAVLVGLFGVVALAVWWRDR